MATPSAENRPGRETIVKAVRKTVWNAQFGVNAERGACLVCQGAVFPATFAIGHYRDGVTGGKAQVNNMRAICRACDRAMGKVSIEAYLVDNPSHQAGKSIARPGSKREKKEDRTRNSRWFDAFTDALWYSDIDIPMPDIKFPNIDFPDINFPDFDFPDFDFDFDFGS